jgi:magnesium-transporting ATPase (P-type)
LAVAVAADAGIGDRVNMAYQNSNVTYGRGLGVIVATGMTTEVGKIASMLQNAEETDTTTQTKSQQFVENLDLCDSLDCSSDICGRRFRSRTCAA